jgi:sugar transferase (PEP-CTERM/EpsH1 system associated)
MFYTARELAREHDVELLVVDEVPVDHSAVEKLETIFEAVHVFSYANYRFHLNALAGAVSRKPLQTHYYQFSTVTGWLDANYRRFDLLYCNHVRTTEYARGYDRPKVVDLVDAISRNYKTANENATGLWRFIYPVEWRRLRRYERRIVREFDHAFIITDADGRFVTGGESWESLSVLPNGVKPELLEREPTEYRADPTDPRIVFLGKMDYFPNVDAAIHFTKNIFPDIRADYPDATFLVVGASPERRVRVLDERPGVSVTGFVDDPRTYVDSADIVVAPMRHGAGLQNKVLEAMALGRPVVASPLASEGIAIQDGRHLVVAEDDEEFATAVGSLVADVDRRRSIGCAARRLIERTYTWERVGKQLRDEVATVFQ